MPDFLETLVKLAAAGTSGICIFAIFAAGYILFKSNKETPPAKYDALKSFMKMAALVAVISAGTTVAAGYWDYKTKVALKEENEDLAETTEEQQETIKVTQKVAVAYKSELEAKTSAIASLQKEFNKIQPEQTISRSQWAKLNANIEEIKPTNVPRIPDHIVIPKNLRMAEPPE